MSLSAMRKGLLGELDLGIRRFEMERWRNLLVMENESRFDQARNSGGIGRMPNVSLDGADVAELFLVRLALKNFPQRFEFNGVADRSARAVRLDVTNGLDGNVGIGLRHGNGLGLAVHAGGEKGSGARAVVVLAGAANESINGIAIGESIGEPL